MTFSFGPFIASNRTHAIAAVNEDGNLPSTVKSILVGAIMADRQDRPVKVYAHGHLFNGTDYEVSSVAIEVKPLGHPNGSSDVKSTR